DFGSQRDATPSPGTERDGRRARSSAARRHDRQFPRAPIFFQRKSAYEIVDELGDAPDYLILPVGNAGNITAYWRGFRQYHAAGRATRLPRMVGAQAEGAAPIVNGSPVADPKTVASAIKIGNPASWEGATSARDESGGAISAVTDIEILSAQIRLAGSEGLFAQPASAAPLALLFRLVRDGQIDKDAGTVSVLA